MKYITKLNILVIAIKVKSKFFQFNHFQNLRNWPQKKRSVKFNFTTPLHWYSANHKRLQINIFHISHIGDLVWVGESDRTAFIDSINITNFWILQFFTMVCLIFHTVIIINRKNWRITIKLHFENLSVFFLKRTYTHARTPLPLFVVVLFSMTPLPSSTNVLWKTSANDCLWIIILFVFGSLYNNKEKLWSFIVKKRSLKLDYVIQWRMFLKGMSKSLKYIWWSLMYQF